MAERAPHHRKAEETSLRAPHGPERGQGVSAPVATEPAGGFVLASGSPRRLELLRAAGFDPAVEAADIDDGALVLGDVGAAATATSLAYFKARRVASLRRRRGAAPAWILAADTVCERDGAILGKPADRAHARAMILSLAERSHGVVTGWCLLAPDAGVRLGLAKAVVEIGVIADEELERFLAEERWKGKAGGYNLPEVVARGWPVRCDGDENAVVGLPILEIAPILRQALGGAA